MNKNAVFYLCLTVFIGAIGFLLFTEHQVHVWGALPYLLLALCPLMHLFMHGSHGKHESHDNHKHP